MQRSSIARLVPLLALVLLGACSAPGPTPDADEDAITAEELREGAAWDGADGSEPEDVDDPPIVSVDEEGAPVDPEIGTSEQGLGKCTNMAGYSRGVRRTVCVVVLEGKYVEVKTATKYLAMKAAARKAGVALKIVSGFRTMAKQRELYRLYKLGKGNLAAPPGYSNHQSGLALDLNTSAPGVYSWLSKHASTYGFRRTVPSEAWHWERR
jgi:hypothetical protein